MIDRTSCAKLKKKVSSQAVTGRKGKYERRGGNGFLYFFLAFSSFSFSLFPLFFFSFSLFFFCPPFRRPNAEIRAIIQLAPKIYWRGLHNSRCTRTSEIETANRRGATGPTEGDRRELEEHRLDPPWHKLEEQCAGPRWTSVMASARGARGGR